MIAEFNGKGVLNKDKWYRVAKRGEKPTAKLLAEYIKIGGATIDLEKKPAPRKRAPAKKAATKKTTKKVVKKK